jgi:hypothetical protein
MVFLWGSGDEEMGVGLGDVYVGRDEMVLEIFIPFLLLGFLYTRFMPTPCLFSEQHVPWFYHSLSSCVLHVCCMSA